MAWTNPPVYTSGAILTAAQMNGVSGNDNALTQARRLTFQQRTTDYVNTSTTIAGAADIFATDLTWTADGTSTYFVEFYASRTQIGASATFCFYYLVSGTGADLGNVGVNFIASLQVPIFVKVPYTPAAGSVSINFRQTVNAGTCTLFAGSGGAGNAIPAWAAVYGPVTTT